jgi:hypothetical protein
MPWLRILLLPALLYLLADFASPYVPGALSFEADGCVDGVRTERLRTSAERPVIVPDTSRPLGRSVPARPAACATDGRDPGRHRIGLARDPRYASPEPAASTDDH